VFLPLVEKRDFYRRFIKSKTDPVRHLVDIQRTLERPICIIPQLMFFSNHPASTRPTLKDIFFGSPQNPGKLRRLSTLFKKPGSIFIEVSDPINLKQFLESTENRERSSEFLALKLRRDLLGQLNAHRKSITGPTIKSPEEIKQEILTGEELRQFMATYAQRREITTFQAHREALGYMDEIAANYSPSFISIVHRVTQRLLATLFESVTFSADALSAIKRSARKGPMSSCLPIKAIWIRCCSPLPSMTTTCPAPMFLPERIWRSGPWARCSGGWVHFLYAEASKAPCSTPRFFRRISSRCSRRGSISPSTLKARAAAAVNCSTPSWACCPSCCTPFSRGPAKI
jgi:hypothetical protein